MRIRPDELAHQRRLAAASGAEQQNAPIAGVR